MKNTKTLYQTFIGFDVSKDTVTVYHSGTKGTVDIENTSGALRRYIRQLNRQCLAICEPTGGYEAALLQALLACNIPVHRADARKVKAFIRSLGIHGKTDAIDAKALAAYGKERQTRLPLWQGKQEKQQELTMLVARRQDLTSLRRAENNRAKAPTVSNRVKTSCRRLITLIETEIREIEAAIQAIIKADDMMTKRYNSFTSFTGIGPGDRPCRRFNPSCHYAGTRLPYQTAGRLSCRPRSSPKTKWQAKPLLPNLWRQARS